MPYRTRDLAPARPTIVCPQCHGTGLDRIHAMTYQTTRTAPIDENARLSAVRCAVCDGLGRTTAEHALVLGLRPE